MKGYNRESRWYQGVYRRVGTLLQVRGQWAYNKTHPNYGKEDFVITGWTPAYICFHCQYLLIWRKVLFPILLPYFITLSACLVINGLFYLPTFFWHRLFNLFWDIIPTRCPNPGLSFRCSSSGFPLPPLAFTDNYLLFLYALCWVAWGHLYIILKYCAVNEISGAVKGKARTFSVGGSVDCCKIPL